MELEEMDIFWLPSVSSAYFGARSEGQGIFTVSFYCPCILSFPVSTKE